MNALKRDAQAPRKAWTAPTVRRLEAGSAEAGSSGVLPDGGGPGANRS